MIRNSICCFLLYCFKQAVSYFNDSFAIVWREKYLHKSTI